MEAADVNMLVNMPPMPKALEGPLEFGNREQIEALREWARQVEEAEALAEKIKAGGLKKFEVHFRISGDIVVPVHAGDEKHAVQLASERWDLDEADLDIEAEYVKEMEAS